ISAIYRTDFGLISRFPGSNPRSRAKAVKGSDFYQRCAFDASLDGFEAQPEILDPRPFRIALPEPPFAPVVFASAHSGRGYTAELLAGVRLRSLNLRRSEDSFVDELFGAAPVHGATLL